MYIIYIYRFTMIYHDLLLSNIDTQNLFVEEVWWMNSNATLEHLDDNRDAEMQVILIARLVGTNSFTNTEGVTHTNTDTRKSRTVSSRVIQLPILGDQTMQMYGTFEEFPL